MTDALLASLITAIAVIAASGISQWIALQSEARKDQRQTQREQMGDYEREIRQLQDALAEWVDTITIIADRQEGTTIRYLDEHPEILPVRSRLAILRVRAHDPDLRKLVDEVLNQGYSVEGAQSINQTNKELKELTAAFDKANDRAGELLRSYRIIGHTDATGTAPQGCPEQVWWRFWQCD